MSGRVGRQIGLALAALVAGALAACGAEDIQLAGPRGGGDGGSSEAGAFAGDGSATCDGGVAAAACKPLEGACGAGAECCSGHCAGGACVVPGSCAGAGSACTSAAGCCSGRCEPVAATRTRQCLPECKPDGEACAAAADCCSLGCHGGKCGGAECLREGTTCAANSDCCSGECGGSGGSSGSGGNTGEMKCVLDPVAPCRASGDDCKSGGGALCCGVCDDPSGRCDPGPASCRPRGSVCRTSQDCCNGACVDDGSGRLECTSAPLADGKACVASFECAGGLCAGNPPACGVPAASPCAAPP